MKSSHPALIGAFVLGAIILSVAGVLIFGAGGLIEDRMFFSLYFDGSVKGLRAGSPVTFRGVPIGKVNDVSVRVGEKREDFRVLVEIETSPEAMVPVDGQGMLQRFNRYNLVDGLVERGLRARLQTQSFVTGVLAIDFDFYPNKPARLIGGKLRYKELPTVPSSIDELAKAVGDLPFKRLVDNAIGAIDSFNQLVQAPELKRSLANLDTSLETIRDLTAKLDQKLLPMMEEVTLAVQDGRQLMASLESEVKPVSSNLQKLADAAEQTMKSADRTLKNVDQTLGTVDQVVGPDSELHYELNRTLRELGAAARSLRILLDELEQRPDMLLRGRQDEGDAS